MSKSSTPAWAGSNPLRGARARRLSRPLMRVIRGREDTGRCGWLTKRKLLVDTRIRGDRSQIITAVHAHKRAECSECTWFRADGSPWTMMDHGDWTARWPGHELVDPGNCEGQKRLHSGLWRGGLSRIERPRNGERLGHG